jgi:3',5'-cyclic AMP phosphodiesterase CpdA
MRPRLLRLRLAAFALGAGLVLGMVSCDWDLTQVLLHSDVETRVRESLSDEIVPPAPVTVDPDSFRFAVFSDIHNAQGRTNHLQRFAQDVAARGIDFFCVCGDLTHNGRADEFRQARAGFDSVGIPYYVTLGNHDLYQADGWQQFREQFGPSCYSVVIAGRLRLIFLDTGIGRLGPTQFDWLEQELTRSAHETKIVLTHFAAYDGLVPGVYRLASGAERAKLQGLLARNSARALCSGHIHAWRHTQVDGVDHFITGTMTDHLDYGSPGYLLFTRRGDSLTWERIEF